MDKYFLTTVQDYIIPLYLELSPTVVYYSIVICFKGSEFYKNENPCI